MELPYFQPRVGDGDAHAAHPVADAELVLGVGGLADRDEELALLCTEAVLWAGILASVMSAGAAA